MLGAVYWYYATPKDNISPATALVNMIYRYHAWLKGIDTSPKLL